MQEKLKPKVIVDTNLWVSFLIGKQLASLKDLLVEGTIQVVLSEQLIAEIQIVTQRPKLIKYFPVVKVEELISLLRAIGFYVEIQSEVDICRDPKDNYLLALAKDSQADFLVTGDRDLLIIEQFENTEILTYPDFLLKL